MARQRNLEARSHILCTAYGLFHEKGFRGTSMDDVARASKIKKANLFHYFPTKEELGLAVFDFAILRLKEKISNACVSENVADPIRFVDQVFSGFLDNMKKNGCCRGCFMGNLAQEMSDHNERLRVKISEYFDFWIRQLSEVLEQGKLKGYFRKDLKPKESAGAILSLLEGALLFSKTRKNVQSLQSARSMAVGYLKFYRS